MEYLDGYRRRCSPAPATYHRRFLLLRRFMRWVAQREGLTDPFAELDAPQRPRQEADWLTPEEFARVLASAERPTRRLAGMAARDRLVLLALVTTGLRRAELVALDWGDLVLGGEAPSLLVRRGKGGKPRRQPLPELLARELRVLEAERRPAAGDPVFTGLQGGRLQPTILAGIVRRSAQRAGIEKHVTAHTLRHTAAAWLRQATGDARLVAEYLGHADLSTVSRYAQRRAARRRRGDRRTGAALPLAAISRRRQHDRARAGRLNCGRGCRRAAQLRSPADGRLAATSPRHVALPAGGPAAGPAAGRGRHLLIGASRAARDAATGAERSARAEADPLDRPPDRSPPAPRSMARRDLGRPGAAALVAVRRRSARGGIERRRVRALRGAARGRPAAARW